jgi:hypothetical protein
LTSTVEALLTPDTRALLDTLLRQESAGEAAAGSNAAYKLTLMKKLSQSTKPAKVKERVADLQLVEARYPMSWSDGLSIAIATFNFAIAVFTGIAAAAAWSSAKLARQAGDDSHQQAEKMKEAMLNAAKANALASRIEFYNEQVASGRRQGWSNDSATSRDQHEHLVCQLDRILDRMGVGIAQPCESSPHNDKVGKWHETKRPSP